MIGAKPNGDGWSGILEGRAEDPMILHGARLEDEPLDPEAAGGDLIAWWDFSADIANQQLVDLGPDAWDGVVRNLPTRGVRGSRWRGVEHCWLHAPRDYAAIQFNGDDLSDCEWDTSFTAELPADLPSGVYGIRLRGDGADGPVEDTIPLWVLPPRGAPTAKIAFLASHLHLPGLCQPRPRQRRRGLQGRGGRNGARIPTTPTSIRNTGTPPTTDTRTGRACPCHPCAAPVLTMRPGFLTFNDARGSGLRHFPADSHLVAWLEAMGHAFDVLTDHDLHRGARRCCSPTPRC